MRHFAVAILALAATGCDRLPAAPTTASVQVSGQVINYATNAGVAGAKVAYGDVAGVTDVTGRYTVTLPALGRYEPLVDGAFAGLSLVSGPAYRGDFIVGGTGCVARYGTIADASTHRPIAGALVTLAGTATTDANGWYRIDLGCPANGLYGFNTIFLTASHPLYNDGSQVAGRGVFGVSRLDLEMQRR